jgi:predicted AAA+ superfamily ATPase
MVDKNLLKELILSQRKIFLKVVDPIKRDVIESILFDKINILKEAIIITGVRRSGKSFLMRLIWKKVKEKKTIGNENFLYFNFEDEKLLNFSADDFSRLLECFYEIIEIDKNGKVYLFLDEIQNISGWEKFINRLLEDGQYKIYITGSNASLLSKEIGTALTGRNYPINLFPLSFKELVIYKLGEITTKDFFDEEKKLKIKKTFAQYLENGGFPEVVISEFRPILQEYLKNIVYRDIMLRRRIKSEINLREIVSFISSNIGVPLSYENIAKTTEIKSRMTVKNYISYLLDTYLFFSIPKHSFSIKKQIYNPDKMYLIDSGMYQEVAVISSPNTGRILENVVFLELKNRNKEIFYFSDKKECDFVVVSKRKIESLIQVTDHLDKNNRDREIAGLLEAMEKYKFSNGLILTSDDEEEIKMEDKIISVKPIWKWLLEN